MDLRLFEQEDLFKATLSFFRDTIGLQLQTKSRMPVDLESQFDARGIKSKKVDEVWSHVDNTYYIGLLDDDNFENEIAEQEESDLQEDLKDVEESDDEYPGILIFVVDMNDEFNPTRSNLTEINRTLNRFSQRVPALVLARYGNKISLMLADRVAYKQEWREGEKVRKVSLLRDIDLDDPHAGHLRILKDLVVPTSGTKKVESFDELYEYWKEVLDTSELNKKFYQDLSNWYFWAIDHVKFPSEPSPEDAHVAGKDHKEMIQEHRATNVIRLLTRLLFVWFIKEKGLIPEELFDLTSLQKDILNDISPYHEEGLLKEANKESIYYKAILQNLFFATLNCPIEASSSDNRERGFRRPKGNFGVTYLMRYEEYFKDRDAFLKLVNSKVPFLNGGLFECLDVRGEKENKEDRVWVDGFSDNLPKEHKLIVPDFLFFGVEEEVDLSEDYGLKSKKYKEAAVRGLLNIFNSYKFTITENTPIEEDVALDPELLGKVFENLLASYNPETKTTARKQTGSFYTPREIVNYMVDESLIAYLKNTLEDRELEEEELDEKLHQLLSYEDTVPFEDDESLQREIITTLSNCTILDPACGSGAFPMGILQKMVHMLQKLDPENEVWKEVQKGKASKEADQAISEIEDKEERQQRLIEINEAFDERINAPDYARKLFLIENCIYGVDIQPVATQISKLRFFISLVVEQKVGEDKSDNFGIRPLPNLETKFVTANTLIDIKDKSNQTSLYETKKIKKLEAELKQVRSKLFSARTTDTKYKYRQKDEELRSEIAEELKQTGWPNDAADKLAGWDPYDQNASSPFFNPEWMFDVSDGFDILVGNPPYKIVKKSNTNENLLSHYQEYSSADFKINLYALFLEKSIDLGKRDTSVHIYIVPDTSLNLPAFKKVREILALKNTVVHVSYFDEKIFENAEVGKSVVLCYQKIKPSGNIEFRHFENSHNFEKSSLSLERLQSDKNYKLVLKEGVVSGFVFKRLSELDCKLSTYCKVYDGINPGSKDLKNTFINKRLGRHSKKVIDGKDFSKYSNIDWKGYYVQYDPELVEKEREALKKSGESFTARIIKRNNFFIKDKIITRQTSDTIIATIDRDKFYAKNSVHSTIIKPKFKDILSLEYICGILNSKLIDWFYRIISMEGGRVFPQVKISRLRTLPMPSLGTIKRTHEVLSNLTKINLMKRTEVLDDIIDSAVLEIYLSDHFKELNINVISFIEEDWYDVMRENNIDTLTTLERDKVIEQLQDRWSNPENEVRKRINSFPEKSPDILKPILEG